MGGEVGGTDSQCCGQYRVLQSGSIPKSKTLKHSRMSIKMFMVPSYISHNELEGRG